MPNARIKNSVASVKVSGTPLNVRVSSFQTGVLMQGNNLVVGTPMGLLLALTYAVSQQAAPDFRGDYRPNVRIN